MTTRVALVTCAQLPDLDSDTRILAASLVSHGMLVVPAVWDDPAVDWDEVDLAVVRSCWDYCDRWSEFVEWRRVFHGWRILLTYCRAGRIQSAAGLRFVSALFRRIDARHRDCEREVDARPLRLKESRRLVLPFLTWVPRPQCFSAPQRL